MIDENGFVLENQVELPFIGFGTQGIQDETIFCAALEAGYRHLDTAPAFQNGASIGKAIKSMHISQREIFLSAKAEKNGDYDSILRDFDKILRELGVSYLDLFLLPLGTGDIPEQWKAMERLYDEGAVRAIGVSGFLPHHLLPLLRTAETKPMANRLLCDPNHIPAATLSFCQSHGLQVIAESPLGQGQTLQRPLLSELAEKYGKTPAQICIRFALQNNALPLPQAIPTEQMKEYLDVFDFDLSLEDFCRLLTLGER